jgi:hypothetical protein
MAHDQNRFLDSSDLRQIMSQFAKRCNALEHVWQWSLQEGQDSVLSQDASRVVAVKVHQVQPP